VSFGFWFRNCSRAESERRQEPEERTHYDFRQPEGAQWLTVPLADGSTEQAAFSDDDFHLIDQKYHGSPDAVATALQASLAVVEDHFHDGRIPRLIGKLIRRGRLRGVRSAPCSN
jgi:hypothetical protein